MILQVSNWSELYQAIKEIENDWNVAVWFRGQNSDWELKPKLFRFGKTEDGYQAFSDFRQESCSYIAVSEFDNFDLYALAQHYGLATRLLDWTKALFAAIYFALDGYKEGQNPVIHCLHPGKLNFSSLGNEKTIESTSPQAKDYALLNDNLDNGKAIAIHPRWNNQRISVQQGMFTCHGGDDRAIDVQCSDSIKSIYLDVNSIENFRRELDTLGVNHGTIYRDLNSYCRVLNKVYELDRS